LDDLKTLGRDVPARPEVVIIGAGFAGLNAAKALARTAVDATIIDRRKIIDRGKITSFSRRYQVATATRRASFVLRTLLLGFVDAEYQLMHPCFCFGQGSL